MDSQRQLFLSSLLKSWNSIELARQTEKIALSDKRITNSHGASFSSAELFHALANSQGFVGSYQETSFSLAVGLQAGETDNRAEDYWGHSSRVFKRLETPEEIALPGKFLLSKSPSSLNRK